MIKRFRSMAAALSAAVVATCLCVTVAASSSGSGRSSAPPVSSAGELRIANVLAGMTLREKVAQMTQADIRYVSPADMAQYPLGSILNGGGAWPGGERASTQADWMALAKAFQSASEQRVGSRVPIVWGTDAVHGHNNVRGAVIFPHNIGLGAARDPVLVRDIGRSVARSVRSTGIRWVFAPTLAVVQNPRWGRTYESFSSNPALVADYARAYVEGLQGELRGPGDVIATAKHFIGDGGTSGGIDQGVTEADEHTLLTVHGAGYRAALAAGAQTVMASYSSWSDPASGDDHGKMHGNRDLLTTVLKERWAFDGFVVSDWNAIGQVPGCTNAACSAAINAGIDMVMVPEEWRAFIENTVSQVERGEISRKRIDEAVTRILRVKWRMGLLEGVSARPVSGDAGLQLTTGQDRDLARRAVRESVVLLKNLNGAVPFSRNARVLLVGEGADSIPLQSGGWSVTWQGTETSNTDFPGATTLLAALRKELGEANVDFLAAVAKGQAVEQYNRIIVVAAESPYAETAGDVRFPAPLSHESRYPRDRENFDAVSGRGVPVIVVAYTGRPQEMNHFLVQADAFLVGWLPGTEGEGIADLLLRDRNGNAVHDFRGRLPFPWPLDACKPASGGNAIPVGYGLGISGRRTRYFPLRQSSSVTGECPVESPGVAERR